MKSNIKWVIFMGLLAALFLIAACAERPGLTPEEKKVFGQQAAVAGKAVQPGKQYCMSPRGGIQVQSCEETADGATVAWVSSSPGGFGGQVPSPQPSTQTMKNACMSGGGNKMAKKISCPTATSVKFCMSTCTADQVCNNGVCTTGLPSEDNFEDASAGGEFTVETGSADATLPPDMSAVMDIQADNVVVVTDADNDMPVVILEKTAGVDLSGVSGQTQLGILGSRVVVQNVPTGVRHHIVLQNTKDAGAYACPNAQSFGDINPSCSGVLTATHEECAQGDDFCKAVGKMYIITVTGSGAGENEGEAEAVPETCPQSTTELCDGCDNNQNGEVDEGCYTCIDGEGFVTITSPSGTSIVITDRCDYGKLNQTSCVASSGQSLNPGVFMPKPLEDLQTCPTECQDPDGPTGATPAVCS